MHEDLDRPRSEQDDDDQCNCGCAETQLAEETEPQKVKQAVAYTANLLNIQG